MKLTFIVRSSNAGIQDKGDGRPKDEGLVEPYYQSRCFPSVPYVSLATLLKCKPTKWVVKNGSTNSCLQFHNRFIDSNDLSDTRDNIPFNFFISDDCIINYFSMIF